MDITLLQTCHGKCYVLVVVKATTGWLETYAGPAQSKPLRTV